MRDLLSGEEGVEEAELAERLCIDQVERWREGVRIPAEETNKLERLTLRHCTLTPGISRSADGSPEQPDTPSLVIEAGITVTRQD